MLANWNPNCLNLPCEKKFSLSKCRSTIVTKNVKIFCVSFSSSLDKTLWSVCECARLIYSNFFLFEFIANVKRSKHSYFPYGLSSFHQIFIFETLEDAISLHDINESILSNGMSK